MIPESESDVQSDDNVKLPAGTIFNIPFVINHAMPSNALAFMTQGDDAFRTPQVTYLRFEPDGDEKAYDSIPSINTSYRVEGFEIENEDLFPTLDEQRSDMLRRRIEAAHRKVIEQITLNGTASRPSGDQITTTCVSPEQPSITCEEIIESMREAQRKLDEMDCDLFVAMLKLGITIRVCDVINDEGSTRFGMVLFIPESKQRALEMAYEKRHRETKYVRPGHHSWLDAMLMS